MLLLFLLLPKSRLGRTLFLPPRRKTGDDMDVLEVIVIASPRQNN